MLKKIQNFLVYLLFSMPFLIFLINETRNPFYIQEVLIIILCTLIFITFIFQKTISIKKLILPEKILLGFWLITFISWLVAFLKFPDWNITIFSEGYRAFVLIIFNTIFVYLLRKTTNDKKMIKNLWIIIFLTAALACIYGLLQSLGVELIWPIQLKPFGNSCISTFGNPNFFASYLILLIPVGFYFSLYTHKFSRYFYIISTLLMILALCYTTTRSAWIGIIAAFFIFLYLFLKIKKINIKKLLLICSVSVIILSAFIFATPFKNDLKNAISSAFSLDYSNQSMHQRILIWKSSFDMFKDHKMIGVGWGLFEAHFPFYQAKYLHQEPYGTYRTHANNCHNEILEILTQTGILGFLLYAAFFISLFIFLLKFLKNNKIDQNKKIFTISLFAGIVGMLFDNILNVTLHFATPALMFWFIISSLIYEISPEYPEEKIHLKNKKLINIPIAVIFVIISISQIRFLLAEIEYFNGFTTINKTKNPTPLTPLTAKKHYEKSKKLHKYSATNLYELGNLSAMLGMYDQAIQNYKDGINANPGYDELYFNLGLIYLKKGKTNNAKDTLKTSYKINPLNPKTILTLFNIALNNEDIISAEKYLKEALILEPKNYVVANNFGVLYSTKNQFKKAIDYYEKALRLKPDYNIAKQNLKYAKNKKQGIFVPFKFELFSDK